MILHHEHKAQACPTLIHHLFGDGVENHLRSAEKLLLVVNSCLS